MTIERGIMPPIQRLEGDLERDTISKLTGLYRTSGIESVGMSGPELTSHIELHTGHGAKERGMALFIAHVTFNMFEYDEPEMAGFATTTYDAEKKGLHIDGLHVVPTARNRKLGRGLMEVCIQQAKDEGADYVEYDLEPEDEAAVALLSKTGFTFNKGAKPRLWLVERPAVSRRPLASTTEAIVESSGWITKKLKSLF